MLWRRVSSDSEAPTALRKHAEDPPRPNFYVAAPSPARLDVAVVAKKTGQEIRVLDRYHVMATMNKAIDPSQGIASFFRVLYGFIFV
jgi:hypothetical protein